MPQYGGGVAQQFEKRFLTFDEFMKGKIGSKEWGMGFRKFGDSLDLKN